MSDKENPDKNGLKLEIEDDNATAKPQGGQDSVDGSSGAADTDQTPAQQPSQTQPPQQQPQQPVQPPQQSAGTPPQPSESPSATPDVNAPKEDSVAQQPPQSSEPPQATSAQIPPMSSQSVTPKEAQDATISPSGDNQMGENTIVPSRGGDQASQVPSSVSAAPDDVSNKLEDYLGNGPISEDDLNDMGDDDFDDAFLEEDFDEEIDIPSYVEDAKKSFIPEGKMKLYGGVALVAILIGGGFFFFGLGQDQPSYTAKKPLPQTAGYESTPTATQTGNNADAGRNTVAQQTAADRQLSSQMQSDTASGNLFADTGNSLTDDGVAGNNNAGIEVVSDQPPAFGDDILSEGAAELMASDTMPQIDDGITEPSIEMPGDNNVLSQQGSGRDSAVASAATNDEGFGINDVQDVVFSDFGLPQPGSVDNTVTKTAQTAAANETAPQTAEQDFPEMEIVESDLPVDAAERSTESAYPVTNTAMNDRAGNMVQSQQSAQSRTMGTNAIRNDDAQRIGAVEKQQQEAQASTAAETAQTRMSIRKLSPVKSQQKFFDSSENRYTDNATNKNAGPDDKVGTARFIVVSNVVKTDSVEAQVEAARRALKMGYYDAAVGMFEKLYNQNSRDLRILMGYAVALQNVGEIGKAVEKYDEVLAIDKNNTAAILNMLGLVKDQYPAVAAKRLRYLLSQSPNNPMIAAQLGIIEASLGNYESALKNLGIAASLEPKNPQHYYNMAIIADRQGRKEQAIKFYEKTLEIDTMSHSSQKKISRDVIYNRLVKLRQ